MSKAVSRLERELGAQLLNRTSRHVSPPSARLLLFERETDLRALRCVAEPF